MSKCRVMFIAIAVLFLSFVTVLAHSGLGGSHDLSWHTIDGGGGISTGGGFEVAGTIGQPDTGVMSGGDFVLSGGFWTPCICPADMDGDCDADPNDVNIFITCFAQGLPCCDFNNDGMCDANDVNDFIIAFVAGCPLPQ